MRLPIMNMIEQIYKDNVAKVYRYAYAKLQNKSEAEDITSHAFLKLMQQDLLKINNYEFWLISVARNAIYDKYKKQQPVDADQSEIESVLDDNEEITETLIKAQELERLNTELHKLNDNEREIVVLKHWEDMRFVQIAEMMRLNESTVKSIYYGALKKLKINLEKEDRKYAAAAYLFSALAAVVTLAEYQPGEIFLSNLLKSLTMSTTTAAVTSAALSTTAKIVLAVGGLSLFTVGTLVGTKINKPQNEVTPVPTVATVEPTVTVEPTIKPTKIVKPSVTPTATNKSFSGEIFLKEVRQEKFAVTIDGSMPSDAIFTNNNTNNGYSKNITIENSNFKMSISEFYATHVVSFTEFETIGVTAFGETLRVKRQNENDNYYYITKTNGFTSTGICDAPAYGSPKAPCGEDQLINGDLGNLPKAAIITVVCEIKTDNAKSQCDDIVKSIKVSYDF